MRRMTKLVKKSLKLGKVGYNVCRYHPGGSAKFAIKTHSKVVI
jgi:hypothetical protein